MAGLVTSSFAVVCLFGPALLRNFTKPPTNYDFAFFECVALQIGSTNVAERTAEELEAATASKQITITDAVFVHSSLSHSQCARRGMASVTALTSMCITTRQTEEWEGGNGGTTGKFNCAK